jgi:phage shock protein A
VDENALERDLLVEHTLSMIERVADGNEYGPAREVERRTVADEIRRMALELDTLRQWVASFKETQQRFQREREKYCAAIHRDPDDRS